MLKWFFRGYFALNFDFGVETLVTVVVVGEIDVVVGVATVGFVVVAVVEDAVVVDVVVVAVVDVDVDVVVDVVEEDLWIKLNVLIVSFLDWQFKTHAFCSSLHIELIGHTEPEASQKHSESKAVALLFGQTLRHLLPKHILPFSHGLRQWQ